MRARIPHLAPVALAIAIGCDSNPGVPAAPRGGSESVAVVKDRPRPRKSGRKVVPLPVKEVSPTVFVD